MPSNTLPRFTPETLERGLVERTWRSGNKTWASTAYANGSQELKTLEARNRTDARRLHRIHQTEFEQSQGKVDKEGAEQPLLEACEACFTFLDTLVGVEDGYSKDTAANYRTAVAKRVKPHAIAQKKVGELDRVDCLNWLRWLKRQPVASFTQNGTVSAVRRTIRHAIEQDWRTTDPFSGISKKEFPKQKAAKPTQPLSKEDKQRLLEAANSDAFKAMTETDYSNLLTLMLVEGPRSSEALGLQHRNIVLVVNELTEEMEGFVVFDHQLQRNQSARAAAGFDQPKNDDKGVRSFKLFPASWAAVQRQIELEMAKGLGAETDLLFTQADGRPITRARLLVAVKRAAKLAGLEDVTARTLRTTFHTNAAYAGISAVEISKRTGNSAAVVESTYVKPIRDAKQDEATMAAILAYEEV